MKIAVRGLTLPQGFGILLTDTTEKRKDKPNVNEEEALGEEADRKDNHSA